MFDRILNTSIICYQLFGKIEGAKKTDLVEMEIYSFKNSNIYHVLHLTLSKTIMVETECKHRQNAVFVIHIETNPHTRIVL